MTVAVDSPNAPPDRDPLVREIADMLWQIEVNYNREGSGPGSRFAGERLETVQARAVIARVREVIDPETRHIIDLRADGWTIKHPLSCRPRLFDCPVNRAAVSDLSPPDVPGRYACEADGGRLRILDRIDEQERR